MSDAALYFTAPYTVETRPVSVGDPDPTELLVETTVSAISGGTELLVYRDETPTGLRADETLDAIDGDFSYPLRYGYAASGVVQAVGEDVDPDWLGRSVFAFVPHQTRFRVDPDQVIPLPAEMNPETGAMLPSIETAVNLTLDAAPRIDEQVVVFGAGVIGLCVVRLLSSFPLGDLVAVDPIESRRELASEMGADRVLSPDDVTSVVDDADLVVEVSGQPTALNAAISVAGFDSRIVVGSWYGTKREPLDLGGRFHRDRIDIVSSQVSTVNPELSGRWDRDRRLSAALERLDDSLATRLITDRIPFDRAGDAYELLANSPNETLQVVFEYE